MLAEKYIAGFVTAICIVWAFTISQFGYIALGLLSGILLNQIDNPKESNLIHNVAYFPYFAMVNLAAERYNENWLM